VERSDSHADGSIGELLAQLLLEGVGREQRVQPAAARPEQHLFAVWPDLGDDDVGQVEFGDEERVVQELLQRRSVSPDAFLRLVIVLVPVLVGHVDLLRCAVRCVEPRSGWLPCRRDRTFCGPINDDR
jgi:hypothetical protein